MTGGSDDRRASRRVAALLRAQIEDGDYQPGDQLPSYRQLAGEHDVAVNTALTAVRLLADEGLVEVRHGSGAFVRSPDADAPPVRVELTNLHERLRRAQQELADIDQTVVRLMGRFPQGASEGE